MKINSTPLAEAAVGSEYHMPVFPREVVDILRPRAGMWIIDGTLGGGGHSEAFLKAGANVTGIDRDDDALNACAQRLAHWKDQFQAWKGNYADLRQIPQIQQGHQPDAILLDLGVSSNQLDQADRGFSFQKLGPLDMRMGQSEELTAYDVVNTWSEAELVKIFFEYGEEPKARRIAASIIQRRNQTRFETTLDLANHILALVGKHSRIHPATRVFQAIRMAVNQELESLKKALVCCIPTLKEGGTIAVITFHSLEDRIVKQFFKHYSTPTLDQKSWAEPKPNPDYCLQLLQRKPILPSDEEIKSNPRARSAKLRVAQLIHRLPS